MADQPHTLAQVTAELVSRGLPKYDRTPSCREWRPPSENCWWVHRPPAEGDDDLTVILCCEGISDDGDQWRFAVESCPCCDCIASVELISDHGGSIASFPWWPGLDAVISLHRQISGLWLAELEREEAT